MTEAAVAGLGLAYVPERYAQPWLATGQLITVLDDWVIASQGIALYFPKHRHMPVTLRLFVDTIKSTLWAQK